jgi:hypothetical protein
VVDARTKRQDENTPRVLGVNSELRVRSSVALDLVPEIDRGGFAVYAFVFCFRTARLKRDGNEDGDGNEDAARYDGSGTETRAQLDTTDQGFLAESLTLSSQHARGRTGTGSPPSTRRAASRASWWRRCPRQLFAVRQGGGCVLAMRPIG